MLRMRMMSFALTERQLMDGTKTVTRRTGWKNLRAGERLLAIHRVRGRKPVRHLCEIEVLSVSQERLGDITPADVLAEGFPQWTNQVPEFVAMFCHHMKVTEDAVVTRIEFRKVPGTERPGTEAMFLVA